MAGQLPVVVLLQAEDEAQESDSSGGSSGHSDGLARSESKKRKRGNKKQPRSAIGVSAEAINEVEGDEPAELITMQSVSHLCLKLRCNVKSMSCKFLSVHQHSTGIQTFSNQTLPLE